MRLFKSTNLASLALVAVGLVLGWAAATHPSLLSSAIANLATNQPAPSAGDYGRSRVDHAFILLPAATIVGQHLETFQQFPPRQKPGSFRTPNKTNVAALCREWSSCKEE